MATLAVRIEGISPLLMHRFAVEKETEIATAKSKKKDQLRTQDDVEKYLYLNEEGQLVQPNTHIIAAMSKAGAKFTITGRGKETYKKIISSGAVIISPDLIPHEFQEYVIDRRAVVVNNARIVRERPKLEKWALNFEIDFDETEVPKGVLYEILVYAGKRVGIGDFRPERGGPFGRFIVTKFE